jgi:micrococcal nuclease
MCYMDNCPIYVVPERLPPTAIQVPVLKVLDGDGFLTRVKVEDIEDDLFGKSAIEATVRFGFVDAPEIEQPGGPEAKEFLTALIGGRHVWIAVLTKMNTGRSVDAYGRIVCVPYLEQDYEHCTFLTSSRCRHRIHCFGQSITVTRNIELEMVLNGWAWVMERYGPDDRYFDALADARNNRRGIWAKGDNVDPWTFKQNKRRNTSGSAQFTPSPAGDACPKQGCEGHLVRRNGRFGPFVGCSNFPKCNFSRSVAPE